MILNVICKAIFEINKSLPLKTVYTVCVTDENQQNICKVDVQYYTKIKKYIYPLNKHNYSSIKCRNIKHIEYKFLNDIIATLYAIVA